MTRPLSVLLFISCCLVLGGCGSTDAGSGPSSASSASSVSASSPSPGLSASPVPTEVRVSACPATMPEPAGTGPAGAFVPPNPDDVLVCRYNRASKLVSAKVLPATLARGLATDLNTAKAADPAIRCPAPTSWLIWIFRGTTQATVKAGWCNHVIGESRAVTLPHTTSMR